MNFRLLTLMFGGLFAVAGCGPAYHGDQRFPLSGTASLDGQPIDLGSITLTPIGDGAKNPSGGVITDGKYDIQEVKGPSTGKFRVELHWLKRTGKRLLDRDTGEMYDQRIEALPNKYHKNSELTIEIPSPENIQNFDLKSS